MKTDEPRTEWTDAEFDNPLPPRPKYGSGGKTPEGLLKTAVIHHLRLMGWFVEINVQGQLTQGKARGRPDLEASKRGITIRVETKAPAHDGANGVHYRKGELSDVQKWYIGELRKAGVVTIVTWDLESFCRDLSEVERRFWPGSDSQMLFSGG